MKKTTQILFTILLPFFVACKNSNSEIIKAHYVEDFCKTEKNHSYIIYIPSHEEDCNNMPLIVVLDPHGSGSSALTRFIESAEKYKCIVVASNLIRNNYSSYIQSIHNLISDIKFKYKASDITFIAGFSGGARMALSYANQNKLNGILAFGALASSNELRSTKINIYSVMGMTDFNFPEIAQYILVPENKPNNLSIEITGDIHEWPDSTVITRSLGYLICKAENKDDLCFSIKKAKNNMKEQMNGYVTELINSGELIKAKLVVENLWNLDNSKETQEKLKFISNNYKYINEFQDFKKSLFFEMKLREAYAKAFSSSDTTWWDKEINVLNKKIDNEQKKYDLFVYKRLKSFLGIMCYSLTRNSLTNNELLNTSKYLHIYKILEPENPDMYYFSALYSLKKGNKSVARKKIHEALEIGFSDTLLILQNFPTDFLEK